MNGDWQGKTKKQIIDSYNIVFTSMIMGFIIVFGLLVCKVLN